MNGLKRHFDLTITTLAPLHIGTGTELLLDYDYVVHGRRTWFLDADRMLEDLVSEDGEFDETLLGRPAAELLVDADFSPDSDLFRYVIDGVPRSRRHGAVLREQIKDVYGRPYLPGSSIKGALRTILAWHGYRSQPRIRLNLREIRGGRSWAAQGLERQIFGQNPNVDLLRALQISDSRPISTSQLKLVNAQVVTGSKQPGAPIEAEAVWQDVSLRATATIDAYLATDAAEKRLRFGSRFDWLTTLPAIGRAWNLEVMAAERAWYTERNYARIAGLYGQMHQIIRNNQLAANQFFVQIGWGGGYNSKTIGAPLHEETAEWERLLRDRRLSPARMRRRSGDPFPKSRRAMVLPTGEPAAPFGWCLAELKEKTA